MDELCQFAEATFFEAAPAKTAGGDTTTVAAHYRQLREHRRKRGREPVKEGEPEDSSEMMPPFALTYLWSVFLQLRRAAGGNGFSPLPISYGEIHAYEMTTGIRLDLWEIDVVMRLDDLYFKKMSEKK